MITHDELVDLLVKQLKQNELILDYLSNISLLLEEIIHEATRSTDTGDGITDVRDLIDTSRNKNLN
jgi:hypothetical protein